MQKQKSLSLYIHIPFCKQKCLYCDFPSFLPENDDISRYTKKLVEEISASASKVQAYTIETIFFGGGTPTLLSVAQLQALMSAIFDNYIVSKNAEITIEANPKTFDETKAKALYDMGFNRMSIGLQAWQNEMLQTLGRIHTVEEFQKSYAIARRVGFSNINVDLMFALPNQTEEIWLATLGNTIGLAPEHISVYSLIYEEGTPFFEKLEKDELRELDENLDRKLYHTAVEVLSQHGYVQYEISNFAKKGKHSRHNLTYWNTTPYLGFGLLAHSYFEGKRFHNTGDFQSYLQNDSAQKKEEVETISQKEAMGEFLFLGLRKSEGIARAEFLERFGEEIHSVFEEEIERCKAKRLLEESETHLYLTKLGVDLSNIVFCEFV
ncbi:MAG: radical SAM family heme chaperone HemW [Bacillota bacterium]